MATDTVIPPPPAGFSPIGAEHAVPTAENDSSIPAPPPGFRPIEGGALPGPTPTMLTQGGKETPSEIGSTADPTRGQKGAIAAGVGWMDDTLQGLKHIPELFTPKEGEKDEKFISEKLGTPGGLAVYKIGKALLNQLAQAKADRDRVAAQGEGLAGKTLTTLEDYPLLGPITKAAEHGDISGALTRGLLDYFAFRGPGEAAKAGEAGLEHLAPTSAKIAGTEVPVLASQEGSGAARALEGAAKAIGSAGERQLGKFAEEQQLAGKKALQGITSEAENKVLRSGQRMSVQQEGALDQIHAAIRDSTSGVPTGTPATQTARGGKVAQQAEMIDGAKFLKRLNELDQKGVLDTALAGNKQHIADMKNLATLMQSGKSAAQADQILRGVRALVHIPTAFASEGGSYVLGKILTSPKASKMLADGLKSGAKAGTVTYAVSKILHDEEPK